MVVLRMNNKVKESRLFILNLVDDQTDQDSIHSWKPSIFHEMILHINNNQGILEPLAGVNAAVL